MPGAGRALVVLTALVALAGCASVDLTDYRTASLASGETIGNVTQLPLESGSIIVNEQPGGGSLFVSLVAERFAPYTHVGIVVVEPEGAMVYESMGAIMPLPWRKPNASVGGGVSRVSLDRFLGRGGITAIHAPPAGVDRSALVAFARARWREHKPFDAFYDPQDDSKYYCVEFVARALESAGAAPFDAAPASRNRSIRVALDWLDIDTPRMLLAGDLVDGTLRLALFSRRLTAPQIARYFELKREIHRRFTDDQRIGNVVSWKHQTLLMRPSVARFFEDGVRNDAEPRQLADKVFGEMSGDAPRLADTR